MRFFLAGIMQGSLVDKAMHEQDYRTRIGEAVRKAFPEAEIYDPLAKHVGSLGYTPKKGIETFFHHNFMCRQVDVLVAFVPQASMGTAIEMWEAHLNGAAVVTISPLQHNWAIKFLSHILYDDLPQFEAELQGGQLGQRIAAVLAERAKRDPSQP